MTMLDLRTASIAVLLSVALLALDGYRMPANCSETTEVSYHDLQPEARKQVDCLAENIYFEAQGEPAISKKAVALVVMNRVHSGDFPTTVCGVVKQKEEGVCQFSWWCNSKSREKAKKKRLDPETYNESQSVAINVYSNYKKLHDITGGALFYHAKYVRKRNLGVKRLQLTAKIGRHIFYIL